MKSCVTWVIPSENAWEQQPDSLITQIKGEKGQFEVWSEVLVITPLANTLISLDRNSILDWIWLATMGKNSISIALPMARYTGGRG